MSVLKELNLAEVHKYKYTYQPAVFKVSRALEPSKRVLDTDTYRYNTETARLCGRLEDCSVANNKGREALTPSHNQSTTATIKEIVACFAYEL